MPSTFDIPIYDDEHVANLRVSLNHECGEMCVAKSRLDSHRVMRGLMAYFDARLASAEKERDNWKGTAEDFHVRNGRLDEEINAANDRIAFLEKTRDELQAANTREVEARRTARSYLIHIRDAAEAGRPVEGLAREALTLTEFAAIDADASGSALTITGHVVGLCRLYCTSDPEHVIHFHPKGCARCGATRGLPTELPKDSPIIFGGLPGHCVSIDGEWWHEPGKCRGAVDNCDGKCCGVRQSSDPVITNADTVAQDVAPVNGQPGQKCDSVMNCGNGIGGMIFRCNMRNDHDSRHQSWRIVAGKTFVAVYWRHATDDELDADDATPEERHTENTGQEPLCVRPKCGLPEGGSGAFYHESKHAHAACVNPKRCHPFLPPPEPPHVHSRACAGCEEWQIEDRLIRECIGTTNGGLADAVRSYIYNSPPVGPKPKASAFDPACSRGEIETPAPEPRCRCWTRNPKDPFCDLCITIGCHHADPNICERGVTRDHPFGVDATVTGARDAAESARERIVPTLTRITNADKQKAAETRRTS